MYKIASIPKSSFYRLEPHVDAYDCCRYSYGLWHTLQSESLYVVFLLAGYFMKWLECNVFLFLFCDLGWPATSVDAPPA